MKRVLKVIFVLFLLILTSEGKLSAQTTYSDGSLDSEFIHSKGYEVCKETQTIAVQNDGKVICTDPRGTYGLVRLYPDGEIDKEFTEKIGYIDGTIRAIAFQDDGKILVGGTFTYYNSYRDNTKYSMTRILRFNSDGTFDDTFQQIGTGFNNSVYAILLQDDGKIIVGGAFTSYNGVSLPYVTRLNSDGSIDSSYSTTGPGFDIVSSMVMQDDGKVIVAGGFVGGTRIARLSTDGTIDTSFALTGTGLNGYIRRVDIQADGKIVIGGDFTSYNGVTMSRIARLNSDGSLDETFVTGTGANGIVRALAIQNDGKIVIGGDFTLYNDSSAPRITRINTNGSIDTSFVPGSGTGGTNPQIYSIVISDDGKLYIGGRFSSFDGVHRQAIALLKENGTLDTTFSQRHSGFNYWVGSSLVQPDGKILVIGSFTLFNETSMVGIAKLDTNGSLDTSFNPGTGFSGTQFSDPVAMVLYPGNRVVVGGWFDSYNGVTNNRIVRLNGDGSLDTSFDSGTGFNNAVYSIATLPNEKILIGGLFTSYNGVTENRIVRVNGDGSLDTSFDPGTGFNNAVTNIVPQSDGKIIVGGGFTSFNGVTCNRIVRLNSDGSLDSSFDSGTGFNASLSLGILSLQADGKIIVSGEFTTYNGESVPSVIRIKSDGTRDSDFQPIITVGAIGEIGKSRIQDDGKILISGYFSIDGDSARHRVVRLNSDGSLDSTFQLSNVGFSAWIHGIQIQADNKILVTGEFLSLGSDDAALIARLGLPDVDSPEGSMVINLDYIYTKDTTVSLSLSASDNQSGVSEMMICNSISFAGCYWEPFSLSKSWVIENGSGTKIVYVKFKDGAGNVSQVYSDSIILRTPNIRVTNIGLIDDIPDSTSITYYFTSTTPLIKGVTQPGSRVYFLNNSNSYSTTANSEGYFSIKLNYPALVHGSNILRYYSVDISNNQSTTKTLTLIIGTEYFPDSLLERLGLISPTQDVTEQEDTPSESIPEEKEKETPQSNIQILQFLNEDGNPMVGALVKIDGVEYYTDSKGEIRVVGLEEGKKYKVKIEYNGEKYETEVLGEESTEGSIQVRVTQADIIKGMDWKKILIYGGISLVVIFLLIILRKKRKKNDEVNT